MQFKWKSITTKVTVERSLYLSILLVGPDSGTSIGCYADDKLSRDLYFEPYGNPGVGMWPPMCIHHCFSKGYYYAGLQNRYMCFCGNSYGKYGKANNCNQSCYGRPNFKCGGINSNSVYTTGLSKFNYNISILAGIEISLVFTLDNRARQI